jgi:hypothetical protein
MVGIWWTENIFMEMKIDFILLRHFNKDEGIYIFLNSLTTKDHLKYLRE